MVRGYVLTREWRDEPGGCRLEIWAATAGGPVKIVLSDLEPVMFVRRADIDRQRIPANVGVRDVTLRALDGQALLALYFPSQRILEQTRETFTEEGVECLEADIPPAERFLMERFIRGSFTATGVPEQRNGFGLIRDPKLQHGDYHPDLRLMSLDIETSPDGGQLYSIAYICGRRRRVLMRGAAAHQSVADSDGFDLTYCTGEQEVLFRFLEDVRSIDPDVLVGWNVINFDLTVLQRRCEELGVAFTLGRDRGSARVFRTSGPGSNALARVPGRVVLDGIECLRSAFWVFDSYTLEAVSRELLGRGKTIESGSGKTAEIDRLFEEDKPVLARYNLQDCQLVLDIFEATDLLAFVVERTRLTGLAMGRQGGSVAAFDYLYLPQLHRRGWVAPSVTRASHSEGSPGGYVLDSVAGIHENVAVLDFKSLYPSIIRTFRIDPLGCAQPGDNPIPGFQGATFSRSNHLLPVIIEGLWEKRDAAKRAGNRPLSQAIKILMNSFYGVLGTEACRFYRPGLASSITRRGHEIIRTSRTWIEEQGYKVIYGDTDSLFVLLKSHSPDLQAQARNLVEGLNCRWSEVIERDYRLPSRLELEMETLFTRFFMPRVRGSDAGSKKRYAGITDTDGGSLVIKGLEAVRSDWTELARKFQRELLDAVFRERDPEPLIHKYVALVRSGRADSQLVYRKRLRRPLDAYRKNVPPHVRAARQLDVPVSEVCYYITESGPQPVQRHEAPIDVDHYIERQIKPVADAVLPFVGLDFDRIVGGQGDLFD